MWWGLHISYNRENKPTNKQTKLTSFPTSLKNWDLDRLLISNSLFSVKITEVISMLYFFSCTSLKHCKCHHLLYRLLEKNSVFFCSIHMRTNQTKFNLQQLHPGWVISWRLMCYPSLLVLKQDRFRLEIPWRF